MPLADIETTYTKNAFSPVDAGFVRAAADQTRFNLRAVFGIVVAANPAFSVAAGDVDNILTRLEFGVPKRLVELAGSSLRLARGELLALDTRGIGTSEEIRSATPDLVIDALGPVTGSAILTKLKVQKNMIKGTRTSSERALQPPMHPLPSALPTGCPRGGEKRRSL